jgi:hypothetical protein
MGLDITGRTSSILLRSRIPSRSVFNHKAVNHKLNHGCSFSTAENWSTISMLA